MLARHGNRFKTGVVRISRGNPICRGLIGLYTHGEIASYGGLGSQMKVVNHAQPYRPVIMAFGAWNNTHQIIKDGQGNALYAVDDAGHYVTGTSPLNQWLQSVNTNNGSIAFFVDSVRRQATGNQVANIEVGIADARGFQIRAGNDGVIWLASSWYTTGSNNVSTDSVYTGAIGERQTAYGHFQRGNMMIAAAGKSATTTGASMDAINGGDAIYFGTDWGGDRQINMMAIWKDAILPEPLARKLTIHKNPIEMFL